MAEVQLPVPPPAIGEASSTMPSVLQQKRGPSIHQIYALPVPIRTFPLPTFYPNNPISLFHVAYAWLGQILSPPPIEPSAIHHGFWSEDTTSVHITDERSMRALWEQGFYGKGSLSRSEPNWLKREQVRRGLREVHVSEILTVQRREERAQAKWERARLEQEAIRRTQLEEAQQAETRPTKLATKPISFPSTLAPVGPLEILALPNSATDVITQTGLPSLSNGELLVRNEPMERLSGASDSTLIMDGIGRLDTGVTGPVHNSPPTYDQVEPLNSNGDSHNGAHKRDQSSAASSDGAEIKTMKRRKSVRFSPTVESATFKLSDPPSPSRSSPVKDPQPALVNGDSKTQLPGGSGYLVANQADTAPDSASNFIVNREHLQLMPEEAFFLSFGLGALTVADARTGRILSSKDLVTLFRQFSYFPPRIGPDEPDLGPDDGFLVNYAVYHHFRSLGWVPRAGIKFGVDWLLYARGPVFDHAEFGLIVIPSYSDQWWKAAGKRGPQKTWPWLHSIVRVLSHVTKSLVLVYVDVPPPPKFEEALNVGITEAMKLFKVRELMVKRWSSNRNR